ncbi:MAG: lipopolysaccharide heptosyltransferase II [Calditrichia bacterium]
MKHAYKKILIIQTAFLGDVILITALIRAVRQLFPESKIDVLVIPETAPVLQNNPHLNQVIQFNKRGKKLLEFIKTARLLRRTGYDLAISPHSSLTSAYLMRAAGIRERLGYDRWRASRQLTMKVLHRHPESHRRPVHKIEKLLRLLSVFSGQNFEIQTELFPTDEMRQMAKKWLSHLENSGKPIIAIAPGSVWNTKKWPEEYYNKLSKMLHAAGYGLVFLGGKSDRALCRRILENTGPNSRNFAGELSILESAAVLEQCRLLICNDSAPLHLANAVQTDVFAFFGPTVKRFGYFPFRPNDRVLEIDLECRPCSSHGGARCPLKHFHCMRKIQPETVFREIEDYLKQGNQGGS